MFKKKSKSIPFARGRRVGPDSIVNQNEQWAARAREANPELKEWIYSSFPFYANEATVVNVGLQTTFNICIMPAISGLLAATHARVTVYTGVTGEDLRVCLYRYYPEKGTTQPRRRLIKVMNSEFVIDCSTTLRTAPTGKDLNGAGAEVRPGEPYFLGYRASSNSIMVPTASADNRGQFPMYYRTYDDDTPLPNEVDLTGMTKTYNGNIPWVTYLSREASLLF